MIEQPPSHVGLTLRSGTHNNLVHVNIGRLLDCEHDGASDRIRRHRKLVSRAFELPFHLRTGDTFCKVCRTNPGEMKTRSPVSPFLIRKRRSNSR